jgi:hypothetical protein
LPILLAVQPGGVLTGLGCGAARTQEQPQVAPCCALRRCPPPQGPGAGHTHEALMY